MAFDEVRLSTEVERGVSGGPRFKTRVLTLESGFEQRNEDWSESRGEWDIGFGLQSLEDAAAELTLRQIGDFFRARRGRLRGFRFKDFFDFTIGDPSDPVASNQEIGTGDGVTVTFQIFKRYSSGGQDYDRTIKKPVAGTVAVLIDGVVDGAAVVDTVTGIVTPSSVPAVAEVVQVACEFDVPVRFDDDHLDVAMQLFDVGQIPRIPIMELRLR